MRLVAEDNDLRPAGWVALTPPRAPKLTTLTERIGNKPVFMDWPVPFVLPCIRPAMVHDGILEVPAYRITADKLVLEEDWSVAQYGGPLGILQEIAEQPEVPTFLKGDPNNRWGKLLAIKPYEDGVAPTVERGEVVRSGMWAPDQGPQQIKH